MPFAGPAFISYNHADKEFASWLATELVAHRVMVWFDEWEMRVGDSLRRKIERGIDTSAYLIIVLSPDSANSEWVATELDGAFIKELEARRVFILPALYRDCDIPLSLRSKMYADFRTNRNEGLRRILEGIDDPEDPPHGRSTSSKYYTDWTTDWQLKTDTHVTEVIINQHSQTEPISVICTITATPNTNLESRLRQYIDYGLEWFAIAFILAQISELTRNEKADVIYIDGAHEANRGIGWRDDKRDMELRVEISARRLGIQRHMDTVFDYGSIIQEITAQHNKRNQLTLPKAEMDRVKEFLRLHPLGDAKIPL